MCWMCDLDKSVARESWSPTLATNFAGDDLALVSAHYQKARTDGFLGGGDGIGDKLDVTYGLAELPVPILDNVADDTSTEERITVGGDRAISTINTPGDQDFYAIQLQAGVTYELAVYGTKQGFSGIALPDAYVEIYDAAGNLIAGTDGGSPNNSLGLDARLTFTAPESGTYYVNARGFDEDGTNGDDGDLVGDYEVFAKVSSYTPYYDVSYESRDNPGTERDERGLPTLEFLAAARARLGHGFRRLVAQPRRQGRAALDRQCGRPRARRQERPLLLFRARGRAVRRQCRQPAQPHHDDGRQGLLAMGEERDRARP